MTIIVAVLPSAVLVLPTSLPYPDIASSRSDDNRCDRLLPLFGSCVVLRFILTPLRAADWRPLTVLPPNCRRACLCACHSAYLQGLAPETADETKCSTTSESSFKWSLSLNRGFTIWQKWRQRNQVTGHLFHKESVFYYSDQQYPYASETMCAFSKDQMPIQTYCIYA